MGLTFNNYFQDPMETSWASVCSQTPSTPTTKWPYNDMLLLSWEFCLRREASVVLGSRSQWHLETDGIPRGLHSVLVAVAASESHMLLQTPASAWLPAWVPEPLMVMGRERREGFVKNKCPPLLERTLVH